MRKSLLLPVGLEGCCRQGPPCGARSSSQPVLLGKRFFSPRHLIGQNHDRLNLFALSEFLDSMGDEASEEAQREVSICKSKDTFPIAGLQLWLGSTQAHPIEHRGRDPNEKRRGMTNSTNPMRDALIANGSDGGLLSQRSIGANDFSQSNARPKYFRLSVLLHPGCCAERAPREPRFRTLLHFGAVGDCGAASEALVSQKLPTELFQSPSYLRHCQAMWLERSFWGLPCCVQGSQPSHPKTLHQNQ